MKKTRSPHGTWSGGLCHALIINCLSFLCALGLLQRAEAAGITFNFTWGPNIPAGDLANVQAAVNYAASQIQANFNDPVTLNITVDGMNTGLGMSSAPLLGTYSLLQVTTALTNDASTANDFTALAHLPTTDPTGGSNFQMSRGLGKALGLLSGTDAASDGTFSFGISNSYTFDPNNRAVSGKYDFIGVAEHELTELMGRVCRENSTGNGWRPLDLYRFNPSGRSTVYTDTNAWFSFNGTTLLKQFNTNGNGGDLGDWASGQGNDAFNAFGGTNAKQDMSAVDLQVMDVIGWNAVPEPSAIVTFGLGAAIICFRKRRRHKTPAVNPCAEWVEPQCLQHHQLSEFH